MSVLDRFRLKYEKEDFQKVCESIESGVVFKGTNLWILIFAVFIASLGLNVNSTAVIIGAMLVSPLMGPIMGIGFSIAVNDLELLKKSATSFGFAISVALGTSTLFFLISPINDAHSEILARTSPNVYDVLIALFGGLAGMLATSSRLKGNVIPGVAIATALMPPLCTVGYGIATFKPEFFMGAMYLFLINTVFIAIATFVTCRFLNFPFKHLPTDRDEVRAKRVIYVVAIVTILPSIYLAYDLVQQNKFNQQANKFVDIEANFPNDYLLKKEIDTKNKKILLVYGGAPIGTQQIESLKIKLAHYDLKKTSLDIKQGFAYAVDNKKENQLTFALAEKDKRIGVLQSSLDSITRQENLSKQIFRELKAQQNTVSAFFLHNAIENTDSSSKQIWMAVITTSKKLDKDKKKTTADWLKARLNSDKLRVYFED